MQFQILAFFLALLGCCLFIGTGAVPTTAPTDVSSREVEVLDERKEGLMEISARLPAPAAVMGPKKRRSLRTRSRGPGGDSDSDSHHDSDSDCAVTRRIRRSLKARAHGPGGDSDDSDRCTDGDGDSDEGVIATRAKTTLARRNRLARRSNLRTRSRGPGGDSGDDSHHDSDSDHCTDDEGTLARRIKKSKRSHGPGGDSDESDCTTITKLKKAKKAKRSASYNIEEDLA